MLPRMIPDDHIAQLEKTEHEGIIRMLDAHARSKEDARKDKEAWLAVYMRCLSPSVACAQTGITYERYKRWRGSCSWFCRAINRCIELAREELVGSAMNRAIGYTRTDEETGEIETDSSGKVIYYGSSDRLAVAILGLEKPELEDKKDQFVQVLEALREHAREAMADPASQIDPRSLRTLPAPTERPVGDGSPSDGTDTACGPCAPSDPD